jgi:phosphorylase kinase gamma subunit
MAPEQAQNKRYSKLVDIWATAMIMYTLIAGHHPLQTSDDTVDTYVEKLMVIQEWKYPPHFSHLA